MLARDPARGGLVLRLADGQLRVARLAGSARVVEGGQERGIRVGADEAVAEAPRLLGAARPAGGHEDR